MRPFFHSVRLALAVRGALAVAFGIAALAWSGITIQVLVLLMGAYVMADGLIATIASVRARSIANLWWIALLEGICGIAAGICAFTWPSVTAEAITVIFGLWAVATGAIEIMLARVLQHEPALFLIGLASAALGVFLIASPGEGAVLLTWILGLYSLLSGALLLGLSHRLRVLAAGSIAV